MAVHYIYSEVDDYVGDEKTLIPSSLRIFHSRKGAIEYATGRMQRYLTETDEKGNLVYELHDPGKFHAKKYPCIGKEAIFIRKDNCGVGICLMVSRVLGEDDEPDADDDNTCGIYYWYHNGMETPQIVEAEKAIQCHDWEKFKELCEKFPTREDGLTNFPDEIAVYQTDGYKSLIGHIPMNKENFMKIEVEEHEKGQRGEEKRDFEIEMLKDTVTDDEFITGSEFLDGYHCLGHLSEFLSSFLDVDNIFGYRWWVFAGERDYIVAWDAGNGWLAKGYFKVDKEPLPAVKRKIFMTLFSRYYKEKSEQEGDTV